MKKLENRDTVRFILNVVLDPSLDQRLREQAWTLLSQMSHGAARLLRQGIDELNDSMISDAVISFCEFASMLDRVDEKLSTVH